MRLLNCTLKNISYSLEYSVVENTHHSYATIRLFAAWNYENIDHLKQTCLTGNQLEEYTGLSSKRIQSMADNFKRAMVYIKFKLMIK